MQKHNRIIGSIMALMLVFGAGSTVVNARFGMPDSVMASSAETLKYASLSYEVLDNGTITITGFDDSVTDLEIPPEIDGKPVTAIGDYAFREAELTSVKFPQSIKSIGNSAFANCRNLESVPMPDSIVEIANGAFYKCISLQSVRISENVSVIGVGAFGHCTSLKEIKIPDSVTTIEGGAFCHCNNLESITIPDNVTIIGGLAFYDTPWINERKTENSIITINNILIDGMSCKGSVVIPDNVTSIADEAFLYCESLTSIEIPDNVTSIGYYTFSECKNLTEVTILNPDCEIYDNSETFTNGWDSTKLTISFNGTIYGYENSTAQEYAEKYKRKFVSLGEAPQQNTATGDLNGDNEFNVSDAVLLQKYILGASDTEISDWKNADLNNDSVLDIFDLCLMKKKLIEK